MTQPIPAELKHHLRQANIVDVDLNIVKIKAQERCAANIISYLQLVILKLESKFSTSQRLLKKLKNHDERVTFTTQLNERIESLHE